MERLQQFPPVPPPKGLTSAAPDVVQYDSLPFRSPLCPQIMAGTYQYQRLRSWRSMDVLKDHAKTFYISRRARGVTSLPSL